VNGRHRVHAGRSSWHRACSSEARDNATSQSLPLRSLTMGAGNSKPPTGHVFSSYAPIDALPVLDAHHVAVTTPYPSPAS